jgi:hypothetical protein
MINSFHKQEPSIKDLAYSRLLPYVKLHMPKYMIGLHHRVIAYYLQKLEKGEITRLAIFMPPRHGKTMLASEFFSAWYLGRNPSHEIIFTTFSQDRADDVGKAVRNRMVNEVHEQVFPGSTLKTDAKASRKFFTEKNGVFYATGWGGIITGRGANCQPAGTMIETEIGKIPIEILHDMEAPPRVLSIDKDGQPCFQRIICSKKHMEKMFMNQKQLTAKESVEQQIICTILTAEDLQDYQISELVKLWYQENSFRKQVDLQKYLILRCVRCQKLFIRTNADVRKNIRNGHMDVYCSAICSKEDHATKNSRRCVNCGDLLGKTKTGGRSGGIYCKNCLKSIMLSRRLPKIKCEECGLWFWPQSKRRQFCSRSCAESAHSKKMRGNQNSHYKDGSSYTRLFYEMKPLILERDNFQCVVCEMEEKKITTADQKSRSNMCTHHINMDPENNKDTNLVSLCTHCHCILHKSNETSFPWLQDYTNDMSKSMTSKLKKRIHSLQMKY